MDPVPVQNHQPIQALRRVGRIGGRQFGGRLAEAPEASGAEQRADAKGRGPRTGGPRGRALADGPFRGRPEDGRIPGSRWWEVVVATAAHLPGRGLAAGRLPIGNTIIVPVGGLLLLCHHHLGRPDADWPGREPGAITQTAGTNIIGY